jgi:hypothetical protein
MPNRQQVTEQIEGLQKIDRHITSEYTNDVPTIMQTISREPRYALVSAQFGAPTLTVLNTREEVASYYAWTHQSHHEPIATRHPKQISTDWYVFCEALPSQRPVGQTEIVLSNYALLFPYADDGMVGEIMWKRSVFSEPASFADVDIAINPPFAAGDVRSLRLSELLASAVAVGSVSKLNAVIAENCEAAVPGQQSAREQLEVLRGRGAVTAWFSRFGQDAEVLRSVSLNLVATPWYVFEERAMSLALKDKAMFGKDAGEQVSFRLASLYKLSEEGTQIDGVAAIIQVDS